MQFEAYGDGVEGFDDHGTEEVESEGDTDAGEESWAEDIFDVAEELVELVEGEAAVGEEGEFREEGVGRDEAEFFGSGEGDSDFGIADEHFGGAVIFDGQAVSVDDILGVGGAEEVGIPPDIPWADDEEGEKLGVAAVSAVVHTPEGEGEGFDAEVAAEIGGYGGEVDGAEILVNAQPEAVPGEGGSHAEGRVIADEGGADIIEAKPFGRFEAFAVLADISAGEVVEGIVTAAAEAVMGVITAGFDA